MNLYGLKGTQYQIESKPSIGSGGEGGVYSVNGHTDKVIKIYHPGVVDAELEEKLKIMVAKPPSSTVLNQVAWPLDLIYDEKKVFRGFVMPKLSIDSELKDIYRYPPVTNVNLKQKLTIAYNVCVVISEVHKAGYVFGDFNPRNIAVNSANGQVAFLDTDGYHIVVDKAKNQAYRARVCKPGYAAPELLEKCAKHISLHPEDSSDAYAKTPLDTFTQETDNFALAIHIFKLLFNGFTPFSGINETDSASTASPGVDDQAVRRDSYCFKPGMKPQSEAVPSLDTVPQEIADLFTRAFMYGRLDPKQRPTADEWKGALLNYENSLTTCKKNSTHMYLKTLSSCPWCEADERYKKAISKPMGVSTAGQRNYQAPITPNNPPIGTAQNYAQNPTGQTYTSSTQGTASGYGTGYTGQQVGGYGGGYTPPAPTPQSPWEKYKMWIAIGVVVLIWMVLLKSCMGGGSSSSNNQRPSQSSSQSSTSSNSSSGSSSQSTPEPVVTPLQVLSVDPIERNPVDNEGATFTIYEGTLQTEDQVDNYSITATVGGRYRFEFSEIRDNGKASIYIYNSLGERVNTAYGGNGSGITTDLEEGETYKISVIQEYGFSPYILTVGHQKERLDISNNTLVNDSLEFTDQKNRYEIAPEISGRYRFEFSELMNNSKASIYIFNRLGEQISSAYGGNGNGITIDLEEGETYKISVVQEYGFSPYTLIVGHQKERIDITNYDLVKDKLEYTDQKNRYSFTPTVGGTHEFIFSDMGDNGKASIYIFNRLGEQINSAYGGNGNGIKMNLEAGETYNISVVQEYNFTPYTINIERP